MDGVNGSTPAKMTMSQPFKAVQPVVAEALLIRRRH